MIKTITCEGNNFYGVWETANDDGAYVFKSRTLFIFNKKLVAEIVHPALNFGGKQVCYIYSSEERKPIYFNKIDDFLRGLAFDSKCEAYTSYYKDVINWILFNSIGLK